MPLTTIALPRNVQFLYEEHLARVEFAALGCDQIEREGDQWHVMRAHVNGHGDRLRSLSAYAGRVDGQPSVYSQLITPAYQGGRFNRTRSVNQYLTHWIYPYRGKFHPQMVRALFNILGVRPGDVVGEPFLGSGTAALEASLLGARVQGVDLSPLCAVLTRVKTQAWLALDRLRPAIDRALACSDPIPPDALRHEDRGIDEVFTVARLVTASDTERRGRVGAKALRLNLSRMLESITAQATAVQEFGLQPGAVDARVGDARDLAAAGVRPGSWDAIVTSPPYSIALDYVKNDEHALAVLGVSINDLRECMTGVRGASAHDKLAKYNEDMRVAFEQVSWALKPGARAAFVVGDATVDGREVTTTDVMVEWAAAVGLRLERRIPKIVFGLYSVMNDEQILIFRRA